MQTWIVVFWKKAFMYLPENLDNLKKNSPVEEFQVFLKSTPGFWLRCVIVGRQYDSKGKLKDWWEPYTVELFRETTTCMRDQYNGFKLEGLQVSVAGSVKSLYNSLSSGTFTMNC